MDRAQFFISFLEQDNKQLKYQQELMELKLLKSKRGKAMMPLVDPDQDEIQSSRTRPNTRGLKRDLQKHNNEDEKLTFEERIAKEVENDREI